MPYVWAHEDIFFTTYRQTETTRKTARKFWTNLVGQISIRRLLRRHNEGPKMWPQWPKLACGELFWSRVYRLKLSSCVSVEIDFLRKEGNVFDYEFEEMNGSIFLQWWKSSLQTCEKECLLKLFVKNTCVRISTPFESNYMSFRIFSRNTKSVTWIRET